MRVTVMAGERCIRAVMRRLGCSRRRALAELRTAWELEVGNMEPVLYDGEDTIQFESGGAEDFEE